MRHARDGFQIRHIVPRISDTLDVDGFGPIVDQFGKGSRVIPDNEFGLNAQTGQEDLELVVRSTVEVGGRDDVIPGVRKCGDGHELRRLTRRCCHRCYSTLEGGHTFLKHIDRRLGMDLD